MKIWNGSIYVCLLYLIAVIGEAPNVIRADVTIGKPDVFVKLPDTIQFLAADTASFRRKPNGFVWISDIEHVMHEKTGEIFLADANPPYYLCGATIPAGRDFELFPYHYYDKEEEEKSGARINYRLTLENLESKPVRVKIDGMGTTTDWEHYKTWEQALRGEGRQVVDLAPGESQVLWEELRLEGGLPWSAIMLGSANGNIRVCDYAYLGEHDPGIESARQMPDLSQPDYLEPSFTRGTSDWNTAEIELFPALRDAHNALPVSKVADGIYAVAFAYSPGGPLSDLCRYKAVDNTFSEDVLDVKDPVSGMSHPFFGGNYPVMYRFSLPLNNDTETTRSINMYLCSNDTLNVDTIAGVWIQERMLHCRVPMYPRGEYWRVFSVAMKPRSREVVEFVVIPLGSRWGGMIACFEFLSKSGRNKK